MPTETNPVKLMTAADLLEQSGHLFSKTHWTSGAFFKLQDNAKPVMCSLGALRVLSLAKGDGLSFDQYIDAMLKEEAEYAGESYDDEPPEVEGGEITTAVEETTFLNDPDYNEAVLRLSLAIYESDPGSSWANPFTNAFGKDTFTVDDYLSGGDQAMDWAENTVIKWNDDSRRTADEVVSVFRRAAEIELPDE